MRFTASRKPESARLDSTCARVERVIRGYLMLLAKSKDSGEKGYIYVRAMDKMPPPAPLIACAMLSDC